MSNLPITVFSVLEVLILLVPVLLSVAFVTIAERKTMASMQRRLGPNSVGYYGLLQAFADAIKLLLKEYVAPTQANIALFFLGPVITLIFGLLGYAALPYGPGLLINDMDLGVLFIVAVSSLATYGILIAGWSANSKYAFLGALRGTAQLISYELVISSATLILIFLTSSFNLTINLEYQRAAWFIGTLAPVFLIFFVASIAETNRPPFDLAEAESELVSGFMTEHAAVVFVFFFLAEYGSMVLMCILLSILFLGGYLSLDFINLINNLLNSSNELFEFIYHLERSVRLIFYTPSLYDVIKYTLCGFTFILSVFLTIFDALFEDIGLFIIIINDTLGSELQYSLIIGLKCTVLIFIFIWTRASFPRIRFDGLMESCWTVFLPILFGIIILVPCIVGSFDIFPVNVFFMTSTPLLRANLSSSLPKG
jgi:NADH-ubiquinone oxidoreductase chain 1